MTSIKVDIITNTLGSDLLTGLLWDISNGGIVIEDDRDYMETIKESIYEDYNPQRRIRDDVIVTLYINDIKKIKNIKDILISIDNGNYGKLVLSYRDYSPEDYELQWKSFHKPIDLNKIVILPDWYDESFNKPLLKINIGSSFGTGQHESTILALKLLESIDLTGKKVLDLGCGSGILGLSSLVLGADYSFMLDIEDVANAKYNSNINCLEDKCSIIQQDLFECDFVADVTICNIYAPVLCQFKDKIVSMTKNNGSIILSGIYQDAIDGIIEAYKDFQLVKLEKIGDWSALMYKRV